MLAFLQGDDEVAPISSARIDGDDSIQLIEVPELQDEENRTNRTDSALNSTIPTNFAVHQKPQESPESMHEGLTHGFSQEEKAFK